MSFARNYERKIDKMAENAIFSVYAVPIFVYQKQTYDDKYVDFSRLFQIYIHFPVFWCIF